MFDKDQEALRLAEAHYQIEAGIREIYRIKSVPDREVAIEEPIMLLEVNENTIASGVMPIHFGPAPAYDIHYSTVVVEVTPDEYQQLRANQLKLPAGWEIRELLPPPARLIAP